MAMRRGGGAVDNNFIILCSFFPLIAGAWHFGCQAPRTPPSHTFFGASVGAVDAMQAAAGLRRTAAVLETRLWPDGWRKNPFGRGACVATQAQVSDTGSAVSGEWAAVADQAFGHSSKALLMAWSADVNSPTVRPPRA